MPIDPSEQAASLLASPQDISPVEQQNRFGARHRTITNLAPDKVVTILAVQTAGEFSSQQFFEILQWLREHYDVESMQTAFVARIPFFGDGFRNDLNLTAHLRAESE